MKIIVKIFFLILSLYLSFSLTAHSQIFTNEAGSGPETIAGDMKKVPKAEKGYVEINDYYNPEVEEEDSFSYDQDFLTRKLFQKKLPPLTQKEQITWSFRMADTNIFL